MRPLLFGQFSTFYLTPFPSILYDGILQKLMFTLVLQWDYSHKASRGHRSLLLEIRNICGIWSLILTLLKRYGSLFWEHKKNKFWLWVL